MCEQKKKLSKCGNIFQNETINFNKPIGKHTTDLKSAEAIVKIAFPLKRPKIRSLGRTYLGGGIFQRNKKMKEIRSQGKKC